MPVNWNDYKNFFEWEFNCKHTGENKMRPEFLATLQQIRSTFGKTMNVSSGFRHWTHPDEILKADPGTHTYGLAADIKIYGEWAMDLFCIAYGYGIRRIGLNQKGPLKSRFIHLDVGDKYLDFPPAIWTY